jgi:prevent-host-death family protein
MNRIATEKNPQFFEQALRQIALGEPVIVSRNGEDLAALVPLSMLKKMIEEEEDRLDVEEARKILNDPSDEVIPWEEAKKELKTR